MPDDLFGFAAPPAPARKKSPPESRLTQTAPPVAPAPRVSDSGEPAGKVSDSPPDSPDDLRPAPPRRATWPRTLPTEAHLADPAFRAVLDALLPWWISDNEGKSYGMSSAEHVLVVLDHLRAANLIPPPPVPYA
jgi:hypothetical protein